MELDESPELYRKCPHCKTLITLRTYLSRYIQRSTQICDRWSENPESKIVFSLRFGFYSDSKISIEWSLDGSGTQPLFRPQDGNLD